MPSPRRFTLRLGGTATPVDDFTLVDSGGELLAPYEVTLPAHASSVTVTVQAARDGETDAAETIEVSASHDGNAIGSVTITITEVSLPPVIFTGGGGGGGPSGPTPSEIDFEWNVTRDIEDLDRDHGDPTGDVVRRRHPLDRRERRWRRRRRLRLRSSRAASG